MTNLKRTNLTLLMTSLLLMAAGQSATAADADTRISITTQGLSGDRAATAVKESSRNEYDALLTVGKRDKTSRATEQQKTLTGDVTANNAAAPNTDFWFYDAWVELYSDVDRDGYYSGLELTFDADTVYSVADVYAVVSLSYEYGPWNEYAETEDFTIFGSVSTDEYYIETDLVSGYLTGNYDILIELYDSYDNSFVASIGPDESSDLAILPLEDQNRDALVGGTTQVVVNQGGGGSLSWFLLAALGLAGAVRKR